MYKTRYHKKLNTTYKNCSLSLFYKVKIKLTTLKFHNKGNLCEMRFEKSKDFFRKQEQFCLKIIIRDFVYQATKDVLLIRAYSLTLKLRCSQRCYRCRHRSSGKFCLAVDAKMRVSEQKFNVRKCKAMRLDESYRLVTPVLFLNSHCGITTIAAVVSFRPRSISML